MRTLRPSEIKEVPHVFKVTQLEVNRPEIMSSNSIVLETILLNITLF